MLFHIFDPGILTHEKAVDTVVFGILVPAVMDAAASHDDHIRIIPDKKVIVYHFF